MNKPYLVERMVPNGPDDFDWEECCSMAWHKEFIDARNHAEAYHSKDNVRVMEEIEEIGARNNVWEHSAY